MDIRINLLEVASELADKDLILAYGDEGGKHRFPEGLVTDDSRYTEEAQEFFDRRYDYWYDFLWELKVSEYE